MDSNLDIEINATKDQIKDFIESVLWKDLVRELELWKSRCDDEMRYVIDEGTYSEGKSTASVLMHLGEINGRQKAINYLLALPNHFLQTLEDRKDDSKRTDTN